MGSYTNLHFINNSSIIWSVASVHQQHQQHQHISIRATAASAHQQHQCIGYRHWKIYLPIYIKSGNISLYPLTSPDELQTPPDTIRHGPDTTRHHHTCIMYGWYGLKHHIVGISGDVTDPDGRKDGRTNKQQAKIELLSFWSVNRWVSQFTGGHFISGTKCFP